MDNRPIGFFDSGLGGLTCIPHLIQNLPHENIIYFGDTARTPYGSKAPETIINFSVEIADYLVESGVKMIVIACNTATSTALDVLSKRYSNVHILGIISPTAQLVADTLPQSARVGVIGTKVTIASNAYKNKISSFNSSIKVFEQATPPLVSLIEEGIIEDQIMDLTIKRYLDEFIEVHRLSHLILGCTHYPLIRKNIEQIYPRLTVIDPSEVIIGSVQEILQKNDMLATDDSHGNSFYASDLSDNFLNMIDRIFESTTYTVAFKNFDHKDTKMDARVYIRRLHHES